MAEITMPQLGETVTEGTITRWFKHVGDQVAENELLFEVSTDKVDSEVPSPAAGLLSEILVQEGDTVDVGTVLARIGDAGSVPAAEPAPARATGAGPAAPGVDIAGGDPSAAAGERGAVVDHGRRWNEHGRTRRAGSGVGSAWHR